MALLWLCSPQSRHQILPRYLILALFIRRVAARDNRETWYAHAYERSYVEVLLLIFLALLSLVFEILWHQYLHRSERSYSFGHLHELVDGSNVHGPVRTFNHDLKHVQLPKELVHRAASEFMTLGFLAFCIFSFNSCGGFEWMVEQFPSRTMHLPKVEEDWLHMAEIVFINMFFGMCTYFIVLTRIVHGCVRKLKLWEQLKLRSKWHFGLKSKMGAARGMRQVECLDAELAEYIHWRQYFVMKMGDLLQKRPDMFKEVLAKIGIQPISPGRAAASPDKDGVVAQFQEHLDRDFSFSAYLAFSVEDGILDSIHIHPVTWSVLMLLFLSFAFLDRFLHLALSRLVPFFLATVFVLMILMKSWVTRKRNSIGREASGILRVPSCISTSAGMMKELHTKHNTELCLLRCMQVTLFLMSYVFARTVLDIHLWNTRPLEALLYTSLFSLFFALLVHTLPEAVPLLLGIMAMPPYVDQTNFVTFCAVLECSRDQGQLVVGTSGMGEESSFRVEVESPRHSYAGGTNEGFNGRRPGQGSQGTIAIDVPLVGHIEDPAGGRASAHQQPSPQIYGAASPSGREM